jgi:hypothetical protein
MGLVAGEMDAVAYFQPVRQGLQVAQEGAISDEE